MLKPFASIALPVLLGNGLGWGALRLTIVLIPRLWAGRSTSTNPLVLIGLTAVSFILLAAPPVLAAALSAAVARRAHLWVGLASGLWALSLLGTVPAAFPIARGLWYAPTVLVLLSGALGGWLMDLRGQGEKIKDEG